MYKVKWAGKHKLKNKEVFAEVGFMLGCLKFYVSVMVGVRVRHGKCGTELKLKPDLCGFMG